MPNLPVYHLGNPTARRTGLSKSRFRGPSLLTINGSKNPPQNSMPAKSSPSRPASTSKKKNITKDTMLNETLEEDINREPDSDTSEEEDSESADILNWDRIEARKKSRNEKQNGKTTVNSRSKSTLKTQIPKGLNASPSSNGSKGAQKRKDHEDTPRYGANMVDVYGRINISGNKRPKYGSSSQRNSGYGKNSSSQKSRTLGSPVTPKKEFQNPDIPSSSQEGSVTPDSSLPKRFRKSSLDLDSPVEETEAKKLFEKPELPESSPLSTGPSTRFQRPEISSSPTNEEGILLKQNDRMSAFHKKLHSIAPSSSVNSSYSIPSRSTKEPPTEDENPATQLPNFINYMDNLPGDVLETARAIISSSDIPLHNISNPAKGPSSSLIMIQETCCPLCNEPVDAEDLKAFGDMNTREQGKFCLLHRKKAAKMEWSIKGYPEINWDKLDSRVSKHYSFIKKLINGSDSYYRNLLEEKVNAGKDRNLRQMTSNLTPGYYGGRGLRAISENIMTKFTPLLKRRMVQDNLMSARGVNPYVQHVLVPELVVIFIQEDMSVMVEEARQILTDSATVGDLLNEELEDVVTKRVEDSEDDENENVRLQL